jgi:hypothetical protein
MQSLGTYGETQKHALLKPTLTAVPSLLYPQTVLLRWEGLRGGKQILALARHLWASFSSSTAWSGGVLEYWSIAPCPKRQSIPDPLQDGLANAPNRSATCNPHISDIARIENAENYQPIDWRQ